MGLAEMKHDAQLANLEMAIRHLQDAGARLIAAREYKLAEAAGQLIDKVRRACDVD